MPDKCGCPDVQWEWVSVPSFGDSFFISYWRSTNIWFSTGFRPLIRGFFFYEIEEKNEHLAFLTLGFRPLIRGFFFYFPIDRDTLETYMFPSPHSGILFLLHLQILYSFPLFRRFPSPHSGILFLSCRYDMPPSLNIFAIFRRILHLLAQKGFSLTQSIHFSPYPSASARIKSFFIHIVPSPIPLNQYIITSSSFISPMPHDLTLVWS